MALVTYPEIQRPGYQEDDARRAREIGQSRYDARGDRTALVARSVRSRAARISAVYVSSETSVELNTNIYGLRQPASSASRLASL